MSHSLRRVALLLLGVAALCFYATLDARELYSPTGVQQGQQSGQVQRVIPLMQGPVAPVVLEPSSYGLEPPVAYRERYAFASPSQEMPSVASIARGAGSWAPPIVAVACAGVVLDRATQPSAFPSGAGMSVDIEALAGPSSV